MKDLDVRKSDTIVCYDMLGNSCASRVHWMLRAFGCENVHILNGHFHTWVQAGLPVEQGDQDGSAFNRIRSKAAKENDFEFTLDVSQVRDFKQTE